MSLTRPSDIPGALATSEARRDAAAALRELNLAFLAHDLDDAGLRSLAARAREATTVLAAAAPRARTFEEIMREPEAVDVLDGDEIDHFDACFVSGEASPVGLAAKIRRDGDGLVARLRFTRAFEGMPGHAHGGILMGVFDDVIGMTMGRMMKIPAPTVRVEVDFRKPIPLDTEVEVRTLLDERTDGRKRYVSATMSVGETVHAEARGLLVILDGNPFAKG